MTDYSEIKAQLESLLRELTDRAEEIDGELSSPGDADSEENAALLADDEVLQRINTVTKDEIHLIKQALNQIAAGTYGVCTSCGKKIKPERLEALPYTSTCIRCA